MSTELFSPLVARSGDGGLAALVAQALVAQALERAPEQGRVV